MSSDEDTIFGIPNPLKDSDEQGAVEDRAPLPCALEDEATTPATVAYVKYMMHMHRQRCPAIRKLRRWAMVASMLLGVLLTLNTLGIVFGKSWIDQAVSKSVRAELMDRWIQSALSTKETFFALEEVAE